jgi:Na+-transporting methylmalonyl-CoA/oxaloacetate decarboxylase gamma subunit
MLQFLLVLAILAVVVLAVSAPIRRARLGQPAPDADRGGDAAPSAPAAADPSEIAELEAARDAKYREIRDAELDHRTGKLSDADFDAVDRELRAEAIEILNALDRARGAPAESSEASREGAPRQS